MPLPTNDEIAAWVAMHIGEFHRKRLEKLTTLDLRDVLKRKNPYLFRAKHIQTAEQLVRALLDAHLSSQEETMFGDFLERLAIWINEGTFGRRKSGISGIDLEFERDGVRYIVAIKSGPNWANSQQLKRLRENFRQAARTLRTSGAKVPLQAVNGCCYGRDSHEDKGDHLKLCGQAFWAFVSGNEALYIDIVEPLGTDARRYNDEFEKAYGQVVNRMTRTVIADFLDAKAGIDWSRLLAFNSGRVSAATSRRAR
ncbi:MAG: cytosolic protein [Rhodanobacteraceae bacterium]|nr:MAG: cytosolic protein [Rhodanobacteraceae bacterium]